MKLSPHDRNLVIRRAVELCADQVANDIEQHGGTELTDAEYDQLSTAIEDDGIRAAVRKVVD